MYSTVKSIQTLTSIMLQAGITEVVISPGSRNAPLAHTFAAAGMQCYEVTDERSAGFFAIGLIQANGGKPVAVCVTSGSAVHNLAPAISEAYYRPLPLLVITADRPAEWIGQMDGQTTRQCDAFNGIVRKCVSLPTVKDDDNTAAWYCNRLVNEALITLHRFSAPVQVNVPITEPFFDFTAEILPTERHIRHTSAITATTTFPLDTQLRATWQSAERPLIIVGQLLPKQASDIAPLLSHLALNGCCIFGEHLSNLQCSEKLHDQYIGNLDAMIAAGLALTPDLVIYIGGHIVSKRLKQWLRTHQPRHCWHVSPSGELADLFLSTTALLETSPHSLLNSLCDIPTENVRTRKEYQAKMFDLSVETAAINKSKVISSPLHGEFTDTLALSAILPTVDSRWTIHTANSMMVRNLQTLFHTANPVHCNRGINGIEGSVSAAVGYWAGSHRPTLLLTGDLSFFYDQSGLWNRAVMAHQAHSPLRIIIINNGGGKIFSHLEGLSSQYLNQYIAAAHATTAEGISLEVHAHYTAAHTYADLLSVLPDFMSDTPDVRILEVFTQSV